jgi:hypothetical protein
MCTVLSNLRQKSLLKLNRVYRWPKITKAHRFESPWYQIKPSLKCLLVLRDVVYFS